jgi:hypothetical protein
MQLKFMTHFPLRPELVVCPPWRDARAAWHARWNGWKLMFWMGAVYNFCTVNESLDGTPAMAAGLTEHIWSVEELLRLKPGSKPLHAIL